MLGRAVSPVSQPQRRRRGDVGHGTRQRRAGATSGPVIFRIPGQHTAEKERQAREYVDAANKALAEGKLAPGRISVNGELKIAKEKAAEDERTDAAKAGKPYGDKVAAHLPDTTWSGTADPPGGWGRHDRGLNSSLGAQSEKYPVGYEPTGFYLEGDPDIPPERGDDDGDSDNDSGDDRPSRRGRR